ncbi:MAG: Glu/Leu/Phe/Val dehydrogenase dimerization domain-containing protein, partial [Gemmatimonadota bacterium]|nr:Glu/Leu/Phe/Val dehydrogenase dimerization domain-containing protein [Gemmatimonadota bacterium]
LMTLKTALADLELGGGKSGIRVDFEKIYGMFKDKFKGGFYEFCDVLKDHVMNEFVYHFIERGLVRQYIPAPDMGSSGREMMLFYNSTHDPAVVTAKPEGIEGWLPGRREATGFGTAYSILKYLEHIGRDPSDTTVSIQGFGNVGSYTAYYLDKYGCKVVAVTDLYGGVHHPEGIDVDALMAHVNEKRTVKGYDDKHTLDNESLFRLPVDILVPAADGHVIGKGNCGTLGVRLLVAEAANMPVSYNALQQLEDRGIDLLPDNYVNSGGVIASDLEYKQGIGGVRYSREEVFAHLRRRFDNMFESILEIKNDSGSFTQAASDIALKRIFLAMKTRSLI